MEKHLCRNRVHLLKHPKFGRYTSGGGGGGDNDFTQLHINNTLHHWALQGHFLNHATDLWFTNRQRWLETTKTELPLHPDRKVLIEFDFTANRRMTQKCTKHKYIWFTELSAPSMTGQRSCFRLVKNRMERALVTDRPQRTHTNL